ncbi:CHAT domain-containing protein [Mycena latifolia]|nr:CHAT domain-containing protein [Mycena latifolia]
MSEHTDAAVLPPERQLQQSPVISVPDQSQESAGLEDLEATLQRKKEVVDLAPKEHPERAARLSQLAFSLTNRYQRLGDLKDLEAALQYDQEAADLTPREHPKRATRLTNLGVSYTDRYHRLGELKDLEASIQLKREALDLTPKGDAQRAVHLTNLGVSYRARYLRLGELKDLEASLQLRQEALDLTPKGDPEQANRLTNLAVSLTDRYRKLRYLEDLDTALENDMKSVELTPKEHPKRANRLTNLAISFRDRYQRLGCPEDLTGALQARQEIVDLTPEGHPQQASRIAKLALSFRERYQRSGDLKDLEAALRGKKEAVDLTPEGNPERASHLATLAVSFMDRYQRLGELNDLEVALQSNQAVVQLTPQGHSLRAGRLLRLATSFIDRYRRFGDLEDLDAALKNDQEALDITPEGHPEQARHFAGLAVTFTHRYRRLRDLADLEAAFQHYQKAVHLTPEGHPRRADRLANLAAVFTDRYERLGDPKDLEAALQHSQEVVNLTPSRHPELPGRLQHLAASFTDIYRSSRDPKDLEGVHNNYVASFTIPTLRPQRSWKAALNWGSFAEQFQPSDCPIAYAAALHLLPEILWMSQSIYTRHEAILRLEIQDATSTATQTCVKLGYISSAVEIMEQGLATIFQQLLQLRTDLVGLHPDHEVRLQQLSSELYHGTSPNPMALAVERKTLQDKIRREPGLEYFLLPKPYSALCSASQGGPVVILNSHKSGCDGIIILNPTSEPVHVPLPNVTLELLQSQRSDLRELLSRCNVRTRADSEATRLFGDFEKFISKPNREHFENMLSWMWTCIVGPIYQVLKSNGISRGRLWWLPTGAFTGLPLHASSPTDDFIHSYTATLGSLLEAYSKKPSMTPPKFGIVGVTHTGPRQMNFLAGVKEEVKKIMPVIKMPLECLEEDRATVDAVKCQLQDCSWVHLACHGKQDKMDPTKSRLLLYGGNLELETILRMPLTNAQFVFLAACQTAMGDADLVNESFHLGGGFIAAGFRVESPRQLMRRKLSIWQ